MESLDHFNKIPASYHTRTIAIEADASKLVASGVGELFVKFGDQPAMVVAAEYVEDLEFVDVQENKGKLVVGTKSKIVTRGISICQTKGRVVCGIVLSRLDKVKITGAAHVTIIDAFQDFINLVISGSGTISASGEIGGVKAEISGAGNIEITQLKAANGELKISGTGSICGHVSNKLSANISGVGNITVLGKPVSHGKKITGIGKLVLI